MYNNFGTSASIQQQIYSNIYNTVYLHHIYNNISSTADVQHTYNNIYTKIGLHQHNNMYATTCIQQQRYKPHLQQHRYNTASTAKHTQHLIYTNIYTTISRHQHFIQHHIDNNNISTPSCPEQHVDNNIYTTTCIINMYAATYT